MTKLVHIPTLLSHHPFNLNNLSFLFQFHFSSLPLLSSKIYFWYSLLFLVFRAGATILIANTVHSNSRGPLKVFRAVPSESWNEELQRFFNQMKAETFAMSGLEFYFVTKKMLLAVIGALLTYEFVLLQFHGEKVDLENFINCEEFFAKV
jgi:hypothetical protein